MPFLKKHLTLDLLQTEENKIIQKNNFQKKYYSVWHKEEKKVESEAEVRGLKEIKTSASCLCKENLCHDNGHPYTWIGESIVWGDKKNKVFMDSIHVLQNKAAKLVLDRAPHFSSTETLSDLNWINLSTRRQIATNATLLFCV